MAELGAKCPKCGGNSFYLYERLEVAHVFEVENGKSHPMRRSEGFPLQLGFSAECGCGHSWVPKRTTALNLMDAEQLAGAGRLALQSKGETK